MSIELSQPTSQEGLTAFVKALDDGFSIEPPASLFRVGFMNDLVRSGQLVLLAGTNDDPMGGILALRAPDFIEMPDMAVAPKHQGKGIGRKMFQYMTEWTLSQGFNEVRWSVSPSNSQAVGAYLSYGGRIIDWIDNAYGVASDVLYSGQANTDRFRGYWRPEWKPTTESQMVSTDDHQQIRSLVLDKWQITRVENGNYELVR